MPSDTLIAYDDLSAQEKVYMFEFIFAEAARIVLDDAAVPSYTNFVTPELQKDRPRVEITFMTGEGKGEFRYVNGLALESAWAGSYSFDVITEPRMDLHGRFLSKVRYNIHRLSPSINNIDPMKFHKLQRFSIDGGTTNAIHAEEGYFLSTIKLNCNVSIQDDAWALLNT